ncbi:MAG TPA: hypothetical protein VK174_14390 [Chitinophagales bacterium]|nr:hypothetical protein [Chitinophagales bacterium]
MKTKIFILLIALLPVTAFAGNGDKNKKKVNIHVKLDKNGKATIDLPPGMKDLENDLNKALKDITINMEEDGKKKEVNVNLQITTK